MREKETYRRPGRERQRGSERQSTKLKETQRLRQRERETARQTQRQRDRVGERQRQREREREIVFINTAPHIKPNLQSTDRFHPHLTQNPQCTFAWQGDGLFSYKRIDYKTTAGKVTIVKSDLIESVNTVFISADVNLQVAL